LETIQQGQEEMMVLEDMGEAFSMILAMGWFGKAPSAVIKPGVVVWAGVVEVVDLEVESATKRRSK
jgi:hypothetical protein